jgi:hypothetical protein
MDNPSKKKQRNKWLALINIPIQMGVIIFLFSLLGQWLDGKFPNKHTVFVKIVTLLGVAIAFYNLNRQLKDINSSE